MLLNLPRFFGCVAFAEAFSRCSRPGHRLRRRHPACLERDPAGGAERVGFALKDGTGGFRRNVRRRRSWAFRSRFAAMPARRSRPRDRPGLGSAARCAAPVARCRSDRQSLRRADATRLRSFAVVRGEPLPFQDRVGLHGQHFNADPAGATRYPRLYPDRAQRYNRIAGQSKSGPT